MALLEQILRREGFGDVLADGVARAAERSAAVLSSMLFTSGVRSWVSLIRNLRRSGGWTKSRTHSRPPHAVLGIRRIESEGVLAPYPEIAIPQDSDKYEAMAKIHALGSSYNQVFSDSGMCLFLNSTGSQFPLVELIRAATGWDFNPPEAIMAGKRIMTLRQAFNVREGLKPEHNKMPPRIAAPGSMGPFAGIRFDFEKLRTLYYQAMGWNGETGSSAACLQDLGLKELIGHLN